MPPAHYRERLAAYAIQPRDILLRFPNRTLYIGPRVQSFWLASTSNERSALPGGLSGFDILWRQMMRCLFFRRRRQTP